jgi:hypothetical protein
MVIMATIAYFPRLSAELREEQGHGLGDIVMPGEIESKHLLRYWSQHNLLGSTTGLKLSWT